MSIRFEISSSTQDRKAFRWHISEGPKLRKFDVIASNSFIALVYVIFIFPIVGGVTGTMSSPILIIV